jgi:hypothetical protein
MSGSRTPKVWELDIFPGLIQFSFCDLTSLTSRLEATSPRSRRATRSVKLNPPADITFDNDRDRARIPWSTSQDMRNTDLIAFLKPIPNQFSTADSVEFIDVTGRVTDIQATQSRLEIRLEVPAGIYTGRFETVPNSFDMSTAMIEMLRVPDGERVPVGPWDLNHIRNVMAVPMARVYANDKLKGGLWFAMPGPSQIAEGKLSAEFGFEAQEGENELILDLIECDRERINWGRLAHFEIRKDDRNFLPIHPASNRHRYLFVAAGELDRVAERWKSTTALEALQKQLRIEDLVFLTDNSQGTLAPAILVTP